eukprot:scaffold22475_cov53-Phaeocystis_antarctica.AAC.1
MGELLHRGRRGRGAGSDEPHAEAEAEADDERRAAATATLLEQTARPDGAEQRRATEQRRALFGRVGHATKSANTARSPKLHRDRKLRVCTRCTPPP